MVQLSEDLRRALAENPGQPVYVEDAETGQQYVLVRVGLYGPAQFQRFLDDGELTDEDMLAAAAAANRGPDGWDAPGMDIYDRPQYDPGQNP